MLATHALCLPHTRSQPAHALALAVALVVRLCKHVDVVALRQGQGPWEKQLHGDPDAAGGWDDNFAFGLNESEEQEIKDQKDAVIFLIDCHRTMQMHNPHNGPD